MEAFLARYRNVTILAVAIFAQLLLLGYQVKMNKDVRLIRIWGVTAITPVARILHGGQQFVSGLWNNYVWLRNVRRQNQELHSELDRLKLENQSLRNAVNTADRLQVLAAYQQNSTSKTLVAEIIGTGANPNSRVVFIDKGEGAGVKPRMAVITPNGIVGEVQAVFPGASLVLLVSDTHCAVGVLLEKSRVHGVMKGTGWNEGRLDYVANEEKVGVGEKVYTSGDDRIYPKGLLVGTVSSARQGPDFQEITVRPAALLDRLEEVLVVTVGVHRELPDTLPRTQAPAALLLPPPPAEAGSDPSGLISRSQAVPATSEGSQPQTDADRLKQRYRELGSSQGHTFGEGLPGSKPPDFNLGWSPPGRRQSGDSKALPAGPGAQDSEPRAHTVYTQPAEPSAPGQGGKTTLKPADNPGQAKAPANQTNSGQARTPGFTPKSNTPPSPAPPAEKSSPDPREF